MPPLGHSAAARMGCGASTVGAPGAGGARASARYVNLKDLKGQELPGADATRTPCKRVHDAPIKPPLDLEAAMEDVNSDDIAMALSRSKGRTTPVPSREPSTRSRRDGERSHSKRKGSFDGVRSNESPPDRTVFDLAGVHVDYPDKKSNAHSFRSAGNNVQSFRSVGSRERSAHSPTPTSQRRVAIRESILQDEQEPSCRKRGSHVSPPPLLSNSATASGGSPQLRRADGATPESFRSGAAKREVAFELSSTEPTPATDAVVCYEDGEPPVNRTATASGIPGAACEP